MKRNLSQGKFLISELSRTLLRILKEKTKGVQYGTYGENRRSLQKHGSKQILKDISYSRGRITAFLGPNGAGEKFDLEDSLGVRSGDVWDCDDGQPISQ